MNSVKVKQALPLTLKVTNCRILRRLVKVITYLATIWRKFKKCFFKEPEFSFFWSSFLLLLRFCFTHYEKKITSLRTRGTFVVTMKCHNKHIHTLQAQPTINNTRGENIILSGTILYTGNTFNRMSEIFVSINISHLSRTLCYSIQKSMLFVTLIGIHKYFWIF